MTNANTNITENAANITENVSQNEKTTAITYSRDTDLANMSKDSSQFKAKANKIINADNSFLVTKSHVDWSTAKGDITELKSEIDNIVKQCGTIRTAALSLSVSILTIKNKELWKPFDGQTINDIKVKNWSDFVRAATGLSTASVYRYKDIGAICTDIAGKALPALSKLSSAKLNELRLEKPTKQEMFDLNDYATKNDITITDENLSAVRAAAKTDKQANTVTKYTKKGISAPFEIVSEHEEDISDDNIVSTARKEILKKRNTTIAKTFTEVYAGREIVTFIVESNNTLRAYTVIGGAAKTESAVIDAMTEVAHTDDDLSMLDDLDDELTEDTEE